MADRHAVIVCI